MNSARFAIRRVLPLRQPHSCSRNWRSLHANGAPPACPCLAGRQAAGRRLRVTRRIAGLTLLVFLCLCSAASSASDSFTDANAQYQAGNFKEAAALYEEMLSGGDRSAAVYYNLANTYFRLGEKAKALVAYERAFLIAPRDPDIRWNIAVLKSTLPDRLEPKDENIFMRWLLEFISWFTMNEISMLVTGILALVALCALLQLAFPGFKTWMGGLRTVALLVLLLTTPLFYLKWQEVRRPRVIVLEQEVYARYGPSSRETKAFTLHEGAEGTVVDEAGDWVNVLLVDKNSGWIPKASCEVI